MSSKCGTGGPTCSARTRRLISRSTIAPSHSSHHRLPNSFQDRNNLLIAPRQNLHYSMLGATLLHSELAPCSRPFRPIMKRVCCLHPAFPPQLAKPQLKSDNSYRQLACAWRYRRRSRSVKNSAMASAVTPTTKVGFIGMGLMGVPMVCLLFTTTSQILSRIC